MRLFRYLSPDAAGGGGAADAGGSQGAGGTGGQPTSGGVKLPGQDKTLEQIKEENKFLRPEALTGILSARDRAQSEALKELRSQFDTKLDGITKALEKLTTAPSGPDKGKKKDDQPTEDPRIPELMRQLNEQQSALAKANEDLTRERKDGRDYRFKTLVTDALARHGCKKVEKVYRMIAQDLQFSEDGTRVFKIVQGQYGPEDLDVDKYIERYVSKDPEVGMPELFESKVRQGAPAGGDSGGAGGKFLFRGTEVTNPKTYLNPENREKIRLAIQSGQVDWSK
jgi:hypothetical protein